MSLNDSVVNGGDEVVRDKREVKATTENDFDSILEDEFVALTQALDEEVAAEQEVMSEEDDINVVRAWYTKELKELTTKEYNSINGLDGARAAILRFTKEGRSPLATHWDRTTKKGERSIRYRCKETSIPSCPFAVCIKISEGKVAVEWNQTFHTHPAARRARTNAFCRDTCLEGIREYQDHNLTSRTAV
eukprot:GHVU01047421.1.p2 GENE.GHVU01047421.1~~GHVU01047421.1.p2  ORF type:complete len:190 (+),score=27.87 GHVU01047421.1:416-985(+)